MALTWTAPSPYPDDSGNKVSIYNATCGVFRAQVYALQPIEDRFYFDISFVSPILATAPSPLVVKDGGSAKTGYFTTLAAVQRAAALKLQEVASRMTSTLGTVK